MDKPLVDQLAEEIRRVDGNHDLGAAALAEALLPWIQAREAELADTSKWEIFGTWLAEHCYEPEYYNGCMVPGSDLAPIIDLSTLPGWDNLTST